MADYYMTVYEPGGYIPMGGGVAFNADHFLKGIVSGKNCEVWIGEGHVAARVLNKYSDTYVTFGIFPFFKEYLFYIDVLCIGEV